MVQDIINQIVEAENTAQKKIDAAYAKAEEIVMSAEIEASNRLEHARTDFKKYVKEYDQGSADIAETNAKAYVDDSKAKAEEQIGKAAANTDKAVKYIIEKLLAK